MTAKTSCAVLCAMIPAILNDCRDPVVPREGKISRVKQSLKGTAPDLLAPALPLAPAKASDLSSPLWWTMMMTVMASLTHQVLLLLLIKKSFYR